MDGCDGRRRREKERSIKTGLNLNKTYFSYNSLGMYLHFQSSFAPACALDIAEQLDLGSVPWYRLHKGLCFNTGRRFKSQSSSMGKVEDVVNL